MQDPAGPPKGSWPSPGLQEVCPAWRAKEDPCPRVEEDSYQGPGLEPRSCKASKARSLPGQTCTGWGLAPGEGSPFPLCFSFLHHVPTTFVVGVREVADMLCIGSGGTVMRVGC